MVKVINDQTETMSMFSRKFNRVYSTNKSKSIRNYCVRKYQLSSYYFVFFSRNKMAFRDIVS